MNHKKSFFQMRIAELPFITIFFFIVMCYNLYFMAPFIFTPAGLTNMVLQMTPFLLLVMGQAAVMLSGNVDLSIGATMVTSSLIMGALINRGVGLGVAIVVALLFCIAIGGINGLLVARCKLMLLPDTTSKIFTLVKLKLPAIVITLVIMKVVIGLGGVFSDGIRWIPLHDLLRVERSTLLTISFLVFLLSLAVWIVLEVTKIGKGIYALGNALNVKELPKVAVILNTVKVYMMSALCAGLAGLFIVFRLGGVSSLMGTGYVELTILAAIIGGISLRGGQGIFVGILIGVLYEQVLRTGLNILGVDVLFARTVILMMLVIFAIINTAQSILIRRAREKVSSQASTTL